MNTIHFFGSQFSKCSQIPLPKSKSEIECTESKNNLSPHYYEDFLDQPNRPILSSFRFGNNSSYIFPIEKFELHGNQFRLTEIVNPNHRQTHHIYKNRYYVANKSTHGKKMLKTVTNLCNAGRAATFWRFLLRTKNQQVCCLALMVRIVLSERRVVNAKLRNQLLFWKNFTADHFQLHPKL